MIRRLMTVLILALVLLVSATAGAWQILPGAAHDIGVGANGAVWVIGTDSVPGGYGIYQSNGAGWTRIDGGAEQISVDPSGKPWVVNSSFNIFAP
jgi:hypothetical protein